MKIKLGKTVWLITRKTRQRIRIVNDYDKNT